MCHLRPSSVGDDGIQSLLNIPLFTAYRSMYLSMHSPARDHIQSESLSDLGEHITNFPCEAGPQAPESS